MSETHLQIPLDAFRATAARIAPYVSRTPLVPWRSTVLDARLHPGTEVALKMELFQPTGTFKVRGAISNILMLDADQRARGITTISGGNHAIAAAYAARCFGLSAKVIMMPQANPARIAAARAQGAEVIVAEGVEQGFGLLERFKQEEGRSYIPSFPNEQVVAGTGTISLEIHEQWDAVDAIIVPVGGGGLISGLAAASKLLSPGTLIYGVEPETAGVVGRSVEAGALQTMDRADTIADSLASPITNACAVSFVSRYVDEVVRISDDAIATALALLFAEAKLAVEPAGAAATAALLGPLRDRLAGKRVVVMACGANIDAAGYSDVLARGAALW
nr:pyridoxal-phosphate dependent enzyme [Sphingomonas sp. Y57]